MRCRGHGRALSCRVALRWALVVLVAGVTAGTLGGAGSGQTAPPSTVKRPHDQTQARFARESTTPFVNPPEVRSKDGVLCETLRVEYGENRVGEILVRSRTY